MFLYFCVYFACMYICVSHVCLVPLEVRKRESDPLELMLIDSWELPLNPGPLEEQDLPSLHILCCEIRIELTFSYSSKLVRLRNLLPVLF